VWNETVRFLIPEIILITAAVAIYLAGAWVKSRTLWPSVASMAIAVAFLALWFGQSAKSIDSALVGPASSDLLGFYGRAFALLIGLLFVLMIAKQAEGDLTPEVIGTLLLLVTGMMLVSAARDMVLVFLGLEMITIPTYILLYLARPATTADSSGQESAVKYFYLSVLAAAILLYGLSFLYGATGTTNLPTLRARLSLPDVAAGSITLARLGLVLVIAGLGFKIAAAPFHFYAPDVYQGTSNPATAILAVAPKVAGFFILVRVVTLALPGVEDSGWRLAGVMAAVTMTWGNVVALWQDNLRRLLAYSSIAHAGYMLIGLAMSLSAAGRADTGGFDPVAAVFFYLAIYSLATVGFLAGLTYLGQSDREVNNVDELAGLSRTHPLPALAMAVFLFSMAGIPPLAGFWGKLMLFGSATNVALSGDWASDPQARWSGILAVVGVMNAAIAAAYYLRIIGIMYFRDPVGRSSANGGRGAAAAMLIAAVLVVGIGCFPGIVRTEASRASQSAKAASSASDVLMVPMGQTSQPATPALAEVK